MAASKLGGVGEVLHFQVGRGVAQAVAFETAHDFLDDKGVAVGDEVGGVGVLVFEPVVIVADHHEAVAGVEFFLAPEDAAADLLVEVVGPAVGPGDDHHVLLAVAVVEVIEQFGEVVAGDDVQVRVGGAGELGERGLDVFGEVLGEGDVLTQGVGVGEDAAVEFLTDDVVEGALGEGEVEFAGQLGAVEGGGDRAADRRQLGVVADEDDAAAGGLQAEFEEVGEEVAVAEPCAGGAGLPKAAVAPDHGGLVHDEDRALAGVRAQCWPMCRHRRWLCGGRCGGGWCWLGGRHSGPSLGRRGRLARAVRRSAEVSQDPDQGGHGGRLSRSGIAANHQATAGLRAHKKPSQRMDERVLTGGRGVRKGALQAVFSFF